jgi:thymidine kinase
MVTEGTQVVVGDTDASDAVAYQVLCRRHHRRRLTRELAAVTLNPDPLPFGEA